MSRKYLWLTLAALAIATFLLLAAGCTPAAEPSPSQPAASQPTEQPQTSAATQEMLTLPALEAVTLAGQPLRVVATTSIIGDVVAQVGGDAIAQTTLMGAGQNPHSYEPAAKDLTAVSRANVIFINGWDLEEALVDNLKAIGEKAYIVPVSANIEPMPFRSPGATIGDDRGSPDPHVWFSIHNVEQWVENIKTILSQLDPANAKTYETNAETYLTELAELDEYAKTQLAVIPPEKRILVTNHSAFGYFARDYDFEVLGTVIPGMSTLAEPSASDLANLIATMQEHGVCTIFTETTVNDTLAQTVAAELSGCADVQVLPLYTGAVGPPGSGADSYIGMFRTNVDTIVEGLK
jgi:ABC-type Zn uptake system ZnuABC Zn-binding protein ZnuA